MAITDRLINLFRSPSWPPKVYVSAGVDGRQYAKSIVEYLRQLGVGTLFDDPTITPGESFSQLLDDHLLRMEMMVAIVTRDSIRSAWKEREIELFLREDRPVFPIVFQSVREFVPRLLLARVIYIEDDDRLNQGPDARTMAELESFLRLRSAKPDRVELSRSPFPPKRSHLNEGKLILVGRGEVGKTSLVRRLAENDFRSDESTTQGIRITKWFFDYQRERLRLNVWDFGGQEIMHATHQFFLTERSLYLIVLNGREGGEDSDAEYWLKHIESFGGDSPVIIVQNKIGQHAFELNYRGLRIRHPQIVGFVKTDCKERIGLEELGELIRDAASKMPDMRISFPQSWLSVKQQLEATAENFLSFDRFRELCRKEGISDDADKDKLSWLMHCLGIALNYRDDPRLRETTVLKPEWVTQGIYRILNAKELAERQGELRIDDLKRILPKGSYPVDKHMFIVELMRKFSLCFPFSEDLDRYLVPELLGKEEPSAASDFVPDDCLNFEYHYGILPEGLIPRFIVRSHTLSRGQARWRSGVILAYEDCRALVTVEPINRRLVVRVKGGNAASRRRLLALVRYDLDQINAEFKDRLDAQLKVPLAGFPAFSVDYKKLVAFERQGVKEFPEFVGQDVITVNVDTLLNGVDLDDQRVTELTRPVTNPTTIFFSYSQKDETLRDELETHLKLLQRQGKISVWHDRKIVAGSEWDGEIDRRLLAARIILLLISADFIATDYCWGKEVELSLDRHGKGEATVIPILLRACDWESAPFAKLQGLPKKMKPITAWEDRDAAWTDVALGIRKIAESLTPKSDFLQ